MTLNASALDLVEDDDVRPVIVRTYCEGQLRSNCELTIFAKKIVSSSPGTSGKKHAEDTSTGVKDGSLLVSNSMVNMEIADSVYRQELKEST